MMEALKTIAFCTFGGLLLFQSIGAVWVLIWTESFKAAWDFFLFREP